MSPWLGDLLAIAAVVAALAWLVRQAVRRMARHAGCGHCGGCDKHAQPAATTHNDRLRP
jgi:hypothetical protein